MQHVYLCLTRQHDLRLVILAGFICLFASFTTVNLLVRMKNARKGRNSGWLSAAATIFGLGVWATHYVAALAYSPGLPISYDGLLTALSLIVAIAVGWFGMLVAHRYRSPLLGGGLIGLAIGATHHLGMLALRAPADRDWSTGYVLASIAIGVIGAAAAMHVLSRAEALRFRLAAAFLLTIAIAGLHFTGMAALTLLPDPLIAIEDSITAPAFLAIATGTVAVLLVAFGLLGALVDQQLALKAAREADRLRHSQEHLARAQRITHTGSIEQDLRTGRTDWSDETYRIFGLDPDIQPPVGDDFLALIHPCDRAICEASRTVSAAHMPIASFRCRIIRPGGAVRWIQRETELALDSEGTPIRWIGTYTDITAAGEAEERQKELQKALQAAKEEAEAAVRLVQTVNDELEVRVEQRTLELIAAQAELLKAERLSALGQLTATVAHELRNPLGAIKNTVFTLKEIAAAKGFTADRPIARLERSIERCNQIISDLLEYSRMPSLNCEIRNFDCWLADVIDEQAIPADILIERDLQTYAAGVSFDPERFRQVIINLVENAAHAIAESRPSRPEKRIILRTREMRGRIGIFIEDTGPGITPENLARAFEPLFSTKSFGTGLGLPTVKQIVEQHGGTIEIASEPGKGTQVGIHLPSVQQELAA